MRNRQLRVEQLESRELLTASTFEQEAVYLINTERLNRDIEPLAVNSQLMNAAGGKSADLQACFDHICDGRGPDDWASDAGYSGSVAETILTYFPPAANEAEATQAVNRWMASSEHRPILLSTNVARDEVGIGRTQVGNNVYWAGLFGRPTDGGVFLTGVVYNSTDGNTDYDFGEGISNVTVRVDGNAVPVNAGGGWSMRVDEGMHTISVCGGAYGTETTATVNVASQNVEANFNAQEKSRYYNNRNPQQAVAGGACDADQNDHPVITSPGDRTAIVGANSMLNFQFTDATPGDVHSAAIDWGDGQPIQSFDSVVSGFSASYTYEAAGSYQPVLWVEDAAGHVDREEFSMTVYPGVSTEPTVSDPDAPVVTSPGPRTATVGSMKIVDFQFADVNPGQTFSASVDWGDGSAFTHLDSVGRSFTATHVYESVGEFHPRVWVTDSTNRTDVEQFSMTIYPSEVPRGGVFVDPEAPIITPPGSLTATALSQRAISFEFDDVNPGQAHSASIDWGDGSPYTHVNSVENMFTSSHAYATVGTYTARVWVTDSTLRSDREEFSVTIYPMPVEDTVSDPVPRAPFVFDPGHRTATMGTEISVTVGFNDPNDSIFVADTHSAAIDWGDGRALTQVAVVTSPFTLSHTYRSAGQYEPIVWVTDHRGLSSSQQFTMDVAFVGLAPEMENRFAQS